MSPLYKVPAGEGHRVVFQSGQDGIQWLALESLILAEGGSWQGRLDGEEAAIVILSGRCDVSIEGDQSASWTGLGGRNDVFSGPGTTVYSPPHSTIHVHAISDLEIAIAKSPCDEALAPTVIGPDDVKIVSSGALNWQREVRLLIPPGSPISHRMIVGETLNPPGNWSGVPPHKHDLNSDIENFLEEFYWFKAMPDDGYGLQLMYSNGDGQGHLIGDDSVAVMLNGYHPTVAAPGVTLCYLWVLAGESKAYDITIDPRFDWVAAAESNLRENKAK